jgi:hypothetical protein
LGYKKNIQGKGNLKHIVITPEIASMLTNNDPHAQVCNEVLGRNIGIRRAQVIILYQQILM